MTTVAGDLLEEGQMVDVMISYHPGDIESVQKLADALRGDGLRVWYADPNVNDEDTSVKGQMVSSSKVFVLMLSENSAQDAQCKDELALAYITNSTIFPVGLQKFRDLSPHVDCGMKLMLAKINWTFFVKDEDFEKNYPGLLSGIQEGVETCADKNFDFDEENPFKFLNSITHVSLEDQSDIEDFWVRHFNDKDEVPWAEFKNQFLKDYGDVIMSTYSEENLNEKFFVNLIYKDIFGSKRNVKWTLYDRFCDGNQSNRPNYFYERLEEYARGLYAMKEVFNMESTLRLTAVQNLGKFSTPSVVSRLLEMLTDADPNIRAVSAIALARAQAKTKKTIAELLKALEDEDRLVRESACFALGFLQSDKAVQAIADKWRNDPISHVRNAAAEALKMMESAEAQKCVHMTEVLTDEMKSLRAEEGH